MRTYAKDTALPGGKYEEGDVDAEGTAVSPPYPVAVIKLIPRGEKHTKRSVHDYQLLDQKAEV
jgi:hypothetical protein